MRKIRKRTRVAFILAVLFGMAALVLCLLVVHWQMAAHTPPSPKNSTLISVITNDHSQDKKDSEGFPDVDWEYWKKINPDIVGWITVPGTYIDSPIIQAHADNPLFYLKHDVYKNYNPHGAIYLDAECEKMGLASRNAVILGHHYGDDTVNAPLGTVAEYTNAGFAQKHAKVLIQTPQTKLVYQVRFAQLVKGWEPTKRVEFLDDADFQDYYEQSLDNAVMKLDTKTRPKQTISLVTCSYNIWVKNERTVLTISMDE